MMFAWIHLGYTNKHREHFARNNAGLGAQRTSCADRDDDGDD